MRTDSNVYILHIVKDVVVIFSEAFSSCDSFIHPFVSSSIHGWHHRGKKTLAEINNPTPSAHVLLSRKGMSSPMGGTPKILISISAAISQVTSSANIKIFSGQGPNEYMWNVIYREVLEM
jgi:hypothetical protein